ncbi:MAG: S8 family serine peptidase [Chromatiales bacterium]|nr:S8 family serine peptidase [Chromatiales bacterium]
MNVPDRSGRHTRFFLLLLLCLWLLPARVVFATDVSHSLGRELDDSISVRTGQRVLLRAHTLSFLDYAAGVPEMRLRLLAEMGIDALFMVALPSEADPWLESRRISDLPGVVYAQPDQLFETVPQRTAWNWKPSYNMDGFDLPASVGLNGAWKVTRGHGSTVALIDDGFDLRSPEFSSLNGAAGFTTSDAFRGERLHGTRVAGVLFARHDGQRPEGVSPEARLMAVGLPSGWTSDLVSALDRASLADVVAISWVVARAARPVKDLIEYHQRHGRSGRGTLFVVSAGNSTDSDFPEGLAGLARVVPVFATDHELRPLYVDPEIDEPLCAPGMLDTVSTLADRDTEKLGGSSAAVPVVAGVLALMLSSAPELSGEQAARLLRATARLVSRGADASCLLVNADAAVSAARLAVALSFEQRTTHP